MRLLPVKAPSSRWLRRAVAVGGQQLDLQGLGGVYTDIFLPLHGEHQAHNAVVAWLPSKRSSAPARPKQLDVDAVREAFASVVNPGRLERVRNAPTVFLDAAHNPHGAKALAAALADEFDFRKLVGVVSVMADKDVGRSHRRHSNRSSTKSSSPTTVRPGRWTSRISRTSLSRGSATNGS